MALIHITSAVLATEQAENNSKIILKIFIASRCMRLAFTIENLQEDTFGKLSEFFFYRLEMAFNLFTNGGFYAIINQKSGRGADGLFTELHYADGG